MKFNEYVNEAKRTCVVVISDCENDFRRRVAKVMRTNKFWEHFAFRGNESYINGPIRGKAKCSDHDEFDAATGLAIARARALNKYNEKWNKEVERLTDVLDEIRDELWDMERDEWHDEEEFFPDTEG